MKLWGGCFDSSTDDFAFKFQSSISVDKRLYKHDILGNIAHAKTLNKCGILSEQETNTLEKELLKLLEEIETGKLTIDESAEDIHSFIECELTSRLGEVAKKIHSARSRNDQVALDIRMYLKDEVNEIVELLLVLEKTLIEISKEHVDTIMPGFTHLQRAQPVTFAHHMMAYFQMFKRDVQRLFDAKKRISVMPLGSGALAGTTFKLDREFTKELVGFDEISANSMDAISDRDFSIEILADISIIMMHLSRFCEELIIWSTNEFSFVSMDDAYSTGSSIMPQKKNPDMAELIRGKTGRVYGGLITLLTVMKSLPLAYNKDMQEDKESLFDAIDTVKSCLVVFNGMISTMKVHENRMYNCTEEGYTNATDLADYLVKKGVSFRDAHRISGEIVKYALKKDILLSKVSLTEYKTFSDLIHEDIYEILSLESCVANRNIAGGPAKEAVLEAIKVGEVFIKSI